MNRRDQKMKSYDYQNRRGIHRVSWYEFPAYTRQLAERLAVEDSDIIMGIARAGLFPATAVACMLRKELYPIRLTRRRDDHVVSDIPMWHLPVRAEIVGGKSVAVVDEIADTGKTLRMVVEALEKNGAREITTAALFCHSWADPIPDHMIVESDALFVFLWDGEVYKDGSRAFDKYRRM